jgi:hypothetical protein
MEVRETWCFFSRGKRATVSTRSIQTSNYIQWLAWLAHLSQSRDMSAWGASLVIESKRVVARWCRGHPPAGLLPEICCWSYSTAPQKATAGNSITSLAQVIGISRARRYTFRESGRQLCRAAAGDADEADVRGLFARFPILP